MRGEAKFTKETRKLRSVVSPATLNIMENITITIPAELADDIQKQIEEYEGEQKLKLWPRVGDRFWWISSISEVGNSIWYNGTSDRLRRDYGNIFRTPEEVESVVNRRKAQAKIDNYIREQGIENKFVWESDNCHPMYNHYDKGVVICHASINEARSPFFVRTKEIAQQIIDAVGADTVELAIRGRVG